MTHLVCARYNENVDWLEPLLESNPESIFIYNKGDELPYPCIKLPNVGREGGTFLHHIIENYDNLADHTLFLQGNPVDHIWQFDKESSYSFIYQEFHANKQYKFKYISQWVAPIGKEYFSNYNNGLTALHIHAIPPIETKKLIECMHFKPIMPLVDYYTLCNLLRKQETIRMHELTRLMETKITCFLTNPLLESARTHLFSQFDLSSLTFPVYFGYGAQFVVSKETIRSIPLSNWKDMYKTIVDSPAAGFGLEKMWGQLFKN
jgi:hypothetical protein